MGSQDLSRLLQQWRQAEAVWEQTSAADAADASLRRAVVDAWRAYNEVAGSFNEDEIVLVADDTMTYVAVFGPTESILGWRPDELVGRPISSVTPPESLAQMEAGWSEFAAQGRLEGSYPLLARDGRRVVTRFRARAHHPVPGYHTSRLRPVSDPPPAAEA